MKFTFTGKIYSAYEVRNKIIIGLKYEQMLEFARAGEEIEIRL